MWLKASARFGVKSISNVTSSSPSALESSVPSFKEESSTIIPSWLSLIPSSLSEQIIPVETSLRILAFFISNSPFGITAPTFANAIFCPVLTLGAPQTTLKSSLPSVTTHNVSLSALGCFFVSLT
ncbi:hypothetical protein ASZ90_003640 [hydrocarbon metagenome]|uniref:Uncharacterized protein n=1 Tax=hydrocarbon metagenome TaxID=938273 RepID=A0A0W8G041_9ZZZZ